VRKPQCSIKLLVFIIFLSALAVTITLSARSVSSQSSWSWVRLEPKGENFSVLMPKQPSQEPVAMSNMPGLTGTAYSATGGKIYYTVKSIRPGRAGSSQARLEDFITKFKQSVLQSSPGAQFTYIRSLNLKGFDGQQYRISTPSMRGLARFYATRQRIYVLEVTGGDEGDAPVGWFLDSFTITEPPPAPSTQSRDAGRQSTRGAGFPPLPTPSPVIIRPSTYYHCACDSLGNPVDQADLNSPLTRDALICTRGDLELTDEAVKHQFNGNVTLEVELLENGTVGAIKVIQSQPYGLEQKAVEAARQYKFCPALQDGQPVTQLMQLTCRFSVRVRTIDTQRPAKRARGRRRP
jgi:TonB family protein